MSQLRSVSLATVCASILLAACGSNSTSNDAGTDAGGNDAGSGDAGTGDGGIPGDGGSPPGAPILSYTTSLTGVQLTWTLPGAFGDERFQVLRSDQGSGFALVPGASSVAADAYSDGTASVLPGVGHAYEVTATTGNGSGPPSNVVHVLQAPGDVTGAASDARALLTWSAIQNASSYDVYRVPLPDAGAGGASTKVGNTLKDEFIDDGSTVAITAGTTYAYQVVAQPLDGGQPSTGSNLITAQARGIDVAVEINRISDLDAGVVDPENTMYTPYAGVFDGGSVTQFNPFSISNATVVPGVPEGPYYLTTDFYYMFPTSARSVNVNSTKGGRVDVVQPTDFPALTAMGYALTGLDAWIETDAGPNDTLLSLSQGAGNQVVGVEDALSNDGGISAGAVAFNGVEVIDGSNDDLNLVDSTKGDVYHLNQFHVQHSSNGELYQTVTKAYTNSSLTMVDGATASISGSMSAVVPTPVTDLVVKASAFATQQAAVNPAAANAGQTVTILAEKDAAIYGLYGTPTPIFAAGTDGGSSDVDFGLAGYGDPFPASWAPIVDVQYGFNMQFDLTGDSAPAIFEATSEFYQPAGTFNFATGITPPLAPVTNVMINGATAFSDQVNVTTSPTISWTAVSSSATPLFYAVSIYELALDDSGAVRIGLSGYPPPQYPLQDWTFYTTATSLKIPAVVFTAESRTAAHWYFATVDAQVTSIGGTGIDITSTPFAGGTNFVKAEMITNKFTPGPGTSPPSTYALQSTGTPPRPAIYRSSQGPLAPTPANGAIKPLASH